jgi:hypothetical protein
MATNKNNKNKTGTTTNTNTNTNKNTTSTNNKNKDKNKDNSNPNNLPLLNYKDIGGDITYDKIEAPKVKPTKFNFTDTNFQYDQVKADEVSAGSVTAGNLAERFMTAADYAMVDPTQISKEFGDVNRQQMRENAQLSSDLALQALDTELQGLQNFAPAAAALKRAEIERDNQFNQAQRDAMLAAGDPAMRADLEAQAARARAFAEGRMPNTIEDRALELGIRSRAADRAGIGGFGARSGAAQKAASLMSAEQRIALSQYGDQALTSNIANRNQLLLAPTSYSDAGQQISVTPTVSGAQAAMQIANEANQYTNIRAETAYQGQMQQEQFRTNLQQETNKFNTGLAAERDLNQANLNMQAATFNVESALKADTANQAAALEASKANAANQLTASTTAAQIRSSETQAKAQLDWNTANANAQRKFEASQLNASNALKVMESNRNAKLEIQKTNKQMIFQDQQNRRAEAAANARAAMSAAVQREQIAANILMAREDREFQLKQQTDAYNIYKENREQGQNVANAGAAGNALGRTETIVNTGVQLINSIQTIRGILGYGANGTNTTSTGSSSSRPVIGQNADGSPIYQV